MTLVSERYLVSDRQLGRGSFSTVYLGTRLYDGLSVAVKVVQCTSITSGRIRREIRILESLQHPHIIPLYEWQMVVGEDGTQTYYLFLRLCQGTLRDLEWVPDLRQREERARELLSGVLQALLYLHEHGYLHRDLKPDNILLATDGGQTLPQLADFGLAGELEPEPGAQTVCGSPLYMAPEVMDRRRYTGQADVWSLGVLLYGLLSPTLPHQTPTVAGIRAALPDLQVSALPLGYSPPLLDLLRQMLDVDPGSRITLQEVATHPWWQSTPVPHTEPQPIPEMRRDRSPYYHSQQSLRIGRIRDRPLGWSGLSRIRGESCPETGYLGFHHVL